MIFKHREKLIFLVKEYGDNGVYILLDMHQDVLWQAGSNEDQGYWGVPKWIKNKLEMPKRLFPWPFTQIAAWECGYLTEEVSRGFGQFYSNVNGVADSFAKFWGFLAEEFKDYESVLGYELINEPFAGDLYQAFSVLLPGQAGSLNLAPLYEKTAAEIRKVDTETLIFYEPVTWGYFAPLPQNPIIDEVLVDSMNTFNLWSLEKVINAVCGPLEMMNLTDFSYTYLSGIANVSVLGPGFAQVPGGPDYNNRSVMSWHYYCEVFDSASDSGTSSSILVQFFCDILFGPDVFNTVKVRTEEIGGGSMLTEFGLCYPNITDTDDKNTVECSRVMDLSDRYFQSWTYWDSSWLWNSDDGSAKPDALGVFSRPYPISTAGQPQNLTFNYRSRYFYYEFFLNTKIVEPTEIFVPSILYPNHKFDLELSSLLTWEFSPHNPDILFVTLQQTKKEEEEIPVFLRITPKIEIVHVQGSN